MLAVTVAIERVRVTAGFATGGVAAAGCEAAGADGESGVGAAGAGAAGVAGAAGLASAGVGAGGGAAPVTGWNDPAGSACRKPGRNGLFGNAWSCVAPPAPTAGSSRYSSAAT